jgi:hypothetical protein
LIYPNPNNGTFYISTDKLDDLVISVYAVDGRILMENIQIKNSNQLINLGSIATGVYIAKIANAEPQKVVRLIVK